MSDFVNMDSDQKLDMELYLKKYIKYKKKYAELLKEIEKSTSFTKGEKVFHIDRLGNRIDAKIKEVHYDDIEPYYTISIDGSNYEKQTVRSKLQKRDE